MVSEPVLEFEVGATPDRGSCQMRDPVHPDRFWMNPYAVAFDHICVSDLLCIDHEGTVVEGIAKLFKYIKFT